MQLIYNLHLITFYIFLSITSCFLRFKKYSPSLLKRKRNKLSLNKRKESFICFSIEKQTPLHMISSEKLQGLLILSKKLKDRLHLLLSLYKNSSVQVLISDMLLTYLIKPKAGLSYNSSLY